MKIADFGFSRLRAAVNKPLGSEFHRAPEMFLKKLSYDGEKADVFALGIVLYAMRIRNFPVNRLYKIITDSPRY